MTIKIEAWLKQNNVVYTAKRNDKDKNIIESNSEYKKWESLKENFDKIKETQFSIQQRMLIAFIFCELRKLNLTSEMLTHTYNYDSLQPEQLSAISLFDDDDFGDDDIDDDYDDEQESENINLEPIDIINLINQELAQTKKQGDYYYLLKIIKHKIQALEHASKDLIFDNDEDDFNNLESASQMPSNISNPSTEIQAPPVELIHKKLNVDAEKIAIKMQTQTIDKYGEYTAWSMLSNVVNYVKNGIWSWFSWSNHFVINHFFDNSEEKQVWDDEKQAVKDAYHEYKQAIDDLVPVANAFNNDSMEINLNKFITEYGHKYTEAETRKQALLDAIKESKECTFISYFNKDLLDFYDDLENKISEHQQTIDEQKISIQQEVFRVQNYYDQLTESLDDIDDDIIDDIIEHRVDTLIQLVNNELIYKDLSVQINTGKPNGKASFLHIIKKASDKIITNILSQNVSQFNITPIDILLEFADTIESDFKTNYEKDMIELRQRLLEKVADVQEHIVKLSSRIDELNQNVTPDIVALAIELFIAAKHGTVDDFPSFNTLERLYNKKIWWVNFATAYQCLNDLLEGQSLEGQTKIDLSQAFKTIMPLVPNAHEYLDPLQRTFKILKEDYPNTAPELYQQMTQIIENVQKPNQVKPSNNIIDGFLNMFTRASNHLLPLGQAFIPTLK